MSRLNICQNCWNKFSPRPEELDFYVAFTGKVFTGVRDICDFCGQANTDGIYVRKETKDVYYHDQGEE